MLSSVASILRLAATSSVLLAATPALACPICGAGSVTYYEWQCDGRNWNLVAVGWGTYLSCTGSPSVVGRVTDSYAEYRAVGGHSTDPGQCNSEHYEPKPAYELCRPLGPIQPFPFGDLGPAEEAPAEDELAVDDGEADARDPSP